MPSINNNIALSFKRVKNDMMLTQTELSSIRMETTLLKNNMADWIQFLIEDNNKLKARLNKLEARIEDMELYRHKINVLR